MNPNVNHAKTSCNLVTKAVNYFKCRQYSLNCCLDESKAALVDYFVSQSNCELPSEVIEQVSENVCNVGESICNTAFTQTSACEDIIDITLSSSAFSCPYVYKVSNAVDGSIYPRLTLVDNSVYHTSKINFVGIPCKGVGSSEVVSSGCSSSGCSNDRNPYGQTQVVIRNAMLYPTGYMKTITIYATDASGNAPLTAHTVDISPANLSAWTSCGSCSGITVGDLNFGSVSFTTALRMLLENVTKTLFGANTSDWAVSKDSNSVYIKSKIKHNPISYWAGINPDSCIYSFYTGSGNVLGNPTPRSNDLGALNPMNSTTSFKQTVDLTSACGSFGSYEVNKYGVYHELDTASSNINYVGISNPNAITPITVSVPSHTCNSTKLSSTVATSGVVATKTWYNSSDVVFGTTNEITVNDADTYTFEVETINGCVASEDITI